MPEYVLLKMAVTPVQDGTVLAAARAYLCISRAAISQMLASLEKRGLLCREIDPVDRRNILVTLTPAGNAALADMDGKVGRRLDSFFACMGEEDMRQFTRLVAKMNDAMETFATKTGGQDDDRTSHNTKTYGAQIH